MMISIFRYVLFTITILVFSTTASADERIDSIVSQLNTLMKSSEGEFGGLISQLQTFPGSLNADKPESKSGAMPFIIGGNDANRNEYQEYTLLIITDTFGAITGTCGGTLIASNKVLTAAHCLQDANVLYFTVPNFYDFNDAVTASDIFEVSSFVGHPSFNPITLVYDIGILTLSNNAPYTPAKILKGTDQLAGSIGTAVGTGAISTSPRTIADTLQEIDVPIANNSACSSAWLSLIGYDPITDLMMCAGFTNNGNGTCFGDSGGPLWTDVQGQRTLVGSASFGASSACEDDRGTKVFARLSSMAPFIELLSPTTQFITSDSAPKIVISPVISLLLDD